MSVPGFLRELRRRKVTRVAVVYAATAFVVVQAADIMLPRLAVPDWAISLIVVLVLLGFPVALVLAWALELTPDGVRVTTTTAQPDPAEPTPSLLGKGTVLVAGGLVILGVGLGAGWFLRPGGVGPEQFLAPPPLNSVAVLPFDNFGADTEDYFSDGITEDIIAQLTRIPDLTVVSRTSAMRYRNTELTVREIGSQLSVGAVLEGSVRRADGRVRIVAQLIDVGTDTHLWAETYDREIADIFAVQSEVAREIASALGRTLMPRRGAGEPGADVPPVDQETYDLYLRGRHLWNQRRPEAVRRAMQYFREAIARAPAFALAHAGIADAYLVLAISDPTVPALALADSALAAGRRALELDPGLGEAYAVLGLASTVAWAHEDAEYYFSRALELTPGYASAHHWSGTRSVALGRVEEGVERLRRALELDPFAPRIHQDLASFLFGSGRREEAIQVLERGRELDPGFADYHLNALLLYGFHGNEPRAFEALLEANELARAGELSPDVLRGTLQDGGLEGAIRIALERAPAIFDSNYRRAGVELYLGDPEAALSSLERAVEAHDGYSAWVGFLIGAPEALANDPRYRALLERVGIPEP